MDFFLKKQANKPTKKRQNNLHTDEVLTELLVNKVASGVGGGKRHHFCPQLVELLNIRDAHFINRHELSEIKTETISRKQDKRADECFSP